MMSRSKGLRRCWEVSGTYAPREALGASRRRPALPRYRTRREKKNLDG